MYQFTIGSVESFERKLEAAQMSLGINPRDFIPVQYVQETSWAVEVRRNLFFLTFLLRVRCLPTRLCASYRCSTCRSWAVEARHIFCF